MEPEKTSEPVTQSPATPGQKGGAGPVIGIIIIIILLALGGYYYFTTGISEISQQDTAMTEEEQLMEQGDSTNLADIEGDLNATDLSGLDDASADFDSELNAQ